jgi:hypothetical protein
MLTVLHGNSFELDRVLCTYLMIEKLTGALQGSPGEKRYDASQPGLIYIPLPNRHRDISQSGR